MPRGNVEIVRRAYERWMDGDFLGDVSFFDPAIVYEVRAEFPDSGTYEGLDRVGRFFQSWLEAWDSISMEAVEVVDAGERVLVAVRQYGTGRVSGIGGELRYFHVWTFRGGMLIRLEAIMDREDALTAAGLAS